MVNVKKIDFMLDTLRNMGKFVLIPHTGNLCDCFLMHMLYQQLDKAKLSYDIKKTPDKTDEQLVLCGNITQIQAILKNKNVKQIVLLPNAHFGKEICDALDERCTVFCSSSEFFDFVQKHSPKSTVYLLNDLWKDLDVKRDSVTQIESNIPLGNRYAAWQRFSTFLPKIRTIHLSGGFYKVGCFLQDTSISEAITLFPDYQFDFSDPKMLCWLSKLFAEIINSSDIVVTNILAVSLVAEQLGKIIFLWKDKNISNIQQLKSSQSELVFSLEPSSNLQSDIREILQNIACPHTANLKEFQKMNPFPKADIPVKKRKQKKSKICFVLDHFIVGGVEMIASSVLTELAKKYKITLLLKRHLIDMKLIKNLRRAGVSVYYPPKPSSQMFLFRMWFTLLKTKRYRKLCKMNLEHSDLIVDYNAFCLLPLAFSITGVPKISFFHNSFLYLTRVFSNNLIPCYDRFVCLSNSCQKDWLKKYPIAKGKVSYIYNPLEIEMIQQKAKEGVAPNHKYFVAVQRLEFDKDVETIIQAFNLFSQKNKDIYLYIVGEGSQKEFLLDLAKDNPRIIFTGKLYNPYPLIKNSEALILSSRKDWGEGLPGVLLEAQALGTLAIASEVKSGTNEILMDGKAGILFPVADEKALAKVMLDVISEKVNRKQLIQTAADNLYRFDKKRIISQIDDLFQKIMNKKTKSIG